MGMLIMCHFTIEFNVQTSLTLRVQLLQPLPEHKGRTSVSNMQRQCQWELQIKNGTIHLTLLVRTC